VIPSQKSCGDTLHKLEVKNKCPSSVQAKQNRRNDRFKSAIRLTEKNKPWFDAGKLLTKRQS